MKLFGLLLLIGVAWIGYSWYAETRDVERFCSVYPQGAVADGMLEMADDLSARLMGPLYKDKTGDWYTLTYCSPIAMCDVSCRIEVRDGLVVTSDLSALQ